MCTSRESVVIAAPESSDFGVRVTQVSEEEFGSLPAFL